MSERTVELEVLRYNPETGAEPSWQRYSVPFRRELPRTTWFLRRPRYIRYMLREITCVFVGAYTLLLLLGVYRLAQGEASYNAFLQGLQNPFSVAFHVAALVFSVYHSVTWFNLTPRAMPLQVGESFLPDAVIAGAHYVGWIVLSLAVLFLGGAF